MSSNLAGCTTFLPQNQSISDDEDKKRTAITTNAVQRSRSHKELTPVHHEHIEVVLYDHGVNIWHHFFKDEKPFWKLIGFIDADLKIGEKHELSAMLYFTKKGRFLLVECDGHSFGSRIADDWPETYYVGFTACEGQNRFYNFKIESPKMTPVWQERLSD